MPNERTWKHPTGRTPEVVDIVALGPSQREYHAHQHAAYNPIMTRADETWTLNKGIRTIKSDLAFVLDDLEGERRQSQRYHADLLDYAAERPIITSELMACERDAWPGQFHDYPLTELVDSLGRTIASRRNRAEVPTARQARDAGLECVYYLHNSIPMILAYALFIGVREVRLYGADYTIRNSDRLEENRPNAEYWVAALRFSGVRVKITSSTTLLNTDRQPHIYGYARAPILDAIPEG